MTTNKPEAKRYTPAYSVDSVMRGHLFMEECERGAWVALEDHEALQAECERLRKDADRWREIRKGGDSVRVVFTDWDAMKDYVLSNEEADAAIDAAMLQGDSDHG